MCSGTELTLLDCSYSYDSTGDENDHSRDVVVYCQQRKFTKNIQKRKCNCYKLSFVAINLAIQ